MRLKEQLKKHRYNEIWQQYCGFLDLSMDGYMRIQKRLMEEQIRLWSDSGLGQSILRGKHPRTLEEFRRMVPLTQYEDYADILLTKAPEMLPGNPVIWIQTTWEGGKHPIKVAPYTRSMLDTYRNNVVACLILSTSTEKGKFDVASSDTFLYALAPLPYATGLFPLALGEDIDIEFLPAVKDAEKMSFSERNKEGFRLAMKKDLSFFFGLGSVAYAVSKSLSSLSGSGGNLSKLLGCSPQMAYRLAAAKYHCSQEHREMMPKDLFRLKGFVVAGTDNRCYKDDLEQLWGIRPMELFAGTEPSILGTETWTRQGMYFFPDTCFYEFITEADMLKNDEDPEYIPPTYLMDEVQPGETYELVFTVLKGGAFARYRCGDMYRCEGLENREDDTHIPRFTYVDRVPWIIDIAGFTRISENGIRSVIELSGLHIQDWVATKEYNSDNRPYLHMYVEMEREDLLSRTCSVDVLKELLSTYFKYTDQDYRDLKKILGMDPLEVTILRCGTFQTYRERKGKGIRHMRPSYYDLKELLETQNLVSVRR